MKCTAFKPLERNTLCGFATIALDSGVVILDVSLHTKNGKRWCSPPSRPMLDKQRQLVIGGDNKIQYCPVISFVDERTRWRWSAAAVAAIDEFLAADGKAPAGAGAMSGGEAPQAATVGARG